MFPNTSSGLARHASTVAFTTARALTSHLRAWFHRRYTPRYRCAGLVFGFDLFLLGVAAAFLVFDAIILVTFFQPMTQGIALDFVTPQTIRGSDATPIEIKFRAIDAKTHEDVLFRLKLPDWVEILSANPPIAKSSIRIGTLRPNQEIVARLVLRIRAPKGTTVPFGFEISQPGFLGISSMMSGKKERTVTENALRVETLSKVKSIVSGGSLPLVILNDGNAAIPLLTLRYTIDDTRSEKFIFPAFAPHEKRAQFIDIGETSASSVRVTWELFDGTQSLDHVENTYPIASNLNVRITSIQAPINKNMRITYTNADHEDYLIVHPQLARGATAIPSTFQFRDGTDIFSHFDFQRPLTTRMWSVLPFRQNGDEGYTFGRRTTGHIASTFPLNAEARYYTALGDQIGIGPLPPKIGETTSYWIVWTVGPIESGLKSLTMSTTLPAHVRATGKFASPFGGTFSPDGKLVSWSVPSLPATGEITTFAFEVTFTPTKGQKGTSAQLVGESTASAIDARSGETLEAIVGGDTTERITP